MSVLGGRDPGVAALDPVLRRITMNVSSLCPKGGLASLDNLH